MEWIRSYTVIPCFYSPLRRQTKYGLYGDCTGMGDTRIFELGAGRGQGGGKKYYCYRTFELKKKFNIDYAVI